MLFNRLFISVLALGAAAIPASATIYCSNGCGANNQTAFNTATTSLFFGSGLENFTTNGTYLSGLTDADGMTGLDFFAYSGTTQGGVTISGSELQQTTGGGNTSLQAQFPPNMVYAYAAFVSVVSGSASPCIEPVSSVSAFGGGNCNNNSQDSISGPSDLEFIGVVSSSPLTSVFIGSFTPLAQGTLEIQSFELGEQPAPTPEVATLFMIGSGLILMRFLRRRANYRLAAAASSKNQVAEPLRVASCAG